MIAEDGGRVACIFVEAASTGDRAEACDYPNIQCARADAGLGFLTGRDYAPVAG
jgi:hypothetical protein